ncbi:Cysteine-rich repeat secretory protein 3 [Hibiscus syriacus]|uniref:Cysteine-rich repeat secretory protein 3 n=1 Tax=Hibiscus syriacus TaxID=106335 RepID=A0A6A3A181_HIBSY|nr:Cysteine-rich repeat secretory protein 3 [Hibiscus syriacus]
MVESGSDITALVYKGCAKQAFTDPAGLFSQALSALFQTLVSQSMKLRFYKTTTGTAQTTINGLFQCRGDLTNNDCYKTCGGGGIGFQEKRDTAFSYLENGVISDLGFLTKNYQSVYVLGQCESDVGDSDCGACVRIAAQRAQVECGEAIAGQVYLHKYFIAYAYHVNGIPKRSSSSSWSSSFSHDSSSSSGQDTGKTVAIILGGAAGVGFVVILLMFARNAMKYHDDS